jgi:hypothetical protein
MVASAAKGIIRATFSPNSLRVTGILGKIQIATPLITKPKTALKNAFSAPTLGCEELNTSEEFSLISGRPPVVVKRTIMFYREPGIP